MPTRQQLQRALRLGEVDGDDLVEVLISYFGGARHESPRELAFPNEGEAKLTLRFSKDLRTCEYAEAGPGLDDEAVGAIAAKVDEEVVASAGARYGTVVLFSLERLVGSWRYQDRLQLRMVPEASPRPTMLYADHPLLMDFTYRSAGEIMANMRRRQRAAARWTQRLNVLVRPGVKATDDSARSHWVFVRDEDAQVRSEYLQAGYAPVGLTVDENQMPPAGAPPVERVSADDYYTRHGTMLQPLTLPTTLEQSISSIEGLPAEALLRFDRAAYWFYCAQHLVHEHSLIAVSLGAAIEAMFEPDPTAPRCPECQRELHGPTARFVDFMSTHLPSEDAEGARRLFAEFYGLRSRPAHGHVFDTDFLPLPSFIPSRLDEEEKVRALFAYVQIALVNWLEARRPVAAAHDAPDMVSST